MNEWKKHLGIPMDVKSSRISEEGETIISEEFIAAAKRKIEKLPDTPGIHTTLARAEDPNDIATVFEHGLFATRNDNPDKDLIFYNEHGPGISFIEDAILSSCILKQGFSITLVIDEALLLLEGAHLEKTAPLASGKPNSVGGHTISNMKALSPGTIKGVVIGVGEKESNEMYEEAHLRVKDTQIKLGRELSGDERISILDDVRTNYIMRYKSDPKLGESLFRLKTSVLRNMLVAFEKTPDFAVPIYDVDGRVLWPT